MVNGKYSKYDLSFKGRYRNLKNAARRNRKLFNITLEEFSLLAVQPCYYCAGHFPKVIKCGGLDRIDNSLGYEPGNVLPCCETCNRTRSDLFSITETKAMIQLVIEMRKSK